MRSLFRVRVGLVSVVGLLLASAAGAVPVTVGLEVRQNGAYLGTFDEGDLGCTATSPVSTCSFVGDGMPGNGDGALMGDLEIDSWSITLDNDPMISGTVAVTNNSAVVQQFTLIFTLPVAPIGSTVTGGSVQGGLTDNTGDGATLATVAGSAFYTPRIDGATFAPGILYAHPQSFSVGAFLSGNVPAASFGTPIPSLAGPAVASDIGIRLDFTLTPGDSASFTSVFVVQVPEPAAALLVLLGVGVALALARRAESRRAA
jgi:hypothetical protein